MTRRRRLRADPTTRGSGELHAPPNGEPSMPTDETGRPAGGKQPNMPRSSLPHLSVHKARRRATRSVAPPDGIPGRRSSGPRAAAKTVAGILAVLLPLGMASATGAAAQPAPVGQGFNVDAGDLAFILEQIRISEQHAATQTPANPCGTLRGTGPDQIPVGANGDTPRGACGPWTAPATTC